ncbi:THUMP domain-containing class I SAM-dependent RNA methyltransferase [Salipiger sp.]|uniref:THUMP domain-containing class I SAM-dependent RNA methyltransferase n=1 Tax=Salipiger sp. TaxID=2078585 RepID=UPI003A96FD75
MNSETPTDMEIFLACAPGLEPVLAEEARDAGFAAPRAVPGGVTTRGDWPEVWRANLVLRGPSRVLVRIGGFPAVHLSQLDKSSRKFDWGAVLRPELPVKVEANCIKSKIYHEGAAQERVARAISEELGAPIGEGGVRLMVRIESNLVTFSLDTSGVLLHKRGHKQAVGKAPMRETLAALFLRQCGYTGTETVLDPMCGSGTFVIEAAEIASGLAPGRSRGFAFETLASFDPAAWEAMKAAHSGRASDLRFFGFDRDQGVIPMARANAERARVTQLTTFDCRAMAQLERPDGAPGLVMVNPPYGGRIGQKSPLFGLYTAMGEVFRTRFRGWRVGIVTSEPGLAKAMRLPFLPASAPVEHGGLKVRLYRTEALR